MAFCYPTLHIRLESRAFETDAVNRALTLHPPQFADERMCKSFFARNVTIILLPSARKLWFNQLFSPQTSSTTDEQSSESQFFFPVSKVHAKQPTEVTLAAPNVMAQLCRCDRHPWRIGSAHLKTTDSHFEEPNWKLWWASKRNRQEEEKMYTQKLLCHTSNSAQL